MSRLSDAITATATGEVKTSRGLNLKYTDIKLAAVSDGRSKQYKIGMTISKTVFLDNTDVFSSEVLPEVMIDLKRALVEEVFGEFRPYLIELRAALYEENTTRARTLLAEMEEQMFVD